MRKPLLALFAVFAALCLFSAPVAAQTVYFDEDFSSCAANLSGCSFVQHPGMDARLVTSGCFPGSRCAEIRWPTDSCCFRGLRTRHNPPIPASEVYYQWTARIVSGSGFCSGSTDFKHFQAKMAAPNAFFLNFRTNCQIAFLSNADDTWRYSGVNFPQDGAWHEFVMQIQSNRVRVWLDRKLIIDAQDRTTRGETVPEIEWGSYFNASVGSERRIQIGRIRITNFFPDPFDGSAPVPPPAENVCSLAVSPASLTLTAPANTASATLAQVAVSNSGSGSCQVGTACTWSGYAIAPASFSLASGQSRSVDLLLRESSVAGRWSDSCTFTASGSTPATVSLDVTFSSAPAPPTITTTALLAGQVGQAYSATLAASGGTPPYTWIVSSGAPPPGLALSSQGVIQGTPATAGSATFSVRVTDSAGQAATRQYTLVIASAPAPPPDDRDARIAELEAQVAALSSQLSTLNSQLAALNAQLASLNSQLTAAQQQLVAANARIAELEARRIVCAAQADGSVVCRIQ